MGLRVRFQGLEFRKVYGLSLGVQGVRPVWGLGS